MFIPDQGARSSARAALATRMAAWLAERPLRDGAIASWIDADGDWSDAYPEIAGYYLSYLACSAVGPEPARAILGWLERITDQGPPLTRYYREPREGDWRNAAVFAFDLAMLVRGLAQTRHVDPSRTDRLLDRCGGALLAIAQDGILASHGLRPGHDADIPRDRWSTTPGVHHLKAAAALAAWPDARAQALAARTIAHWAPRLTTVIAEGRTELAHPYIYGIEGLLIHHGATGDTASADIAAEAFRALMPLLTGDQDGNRGHAGDVAAQTIRAGAALQRLGRLPASGWAATREVALRRLLSLQTDEGAVLFDRRGHRNTWATLFAWQALHMLDAADGAPPDPCANIGLII